MENEGDYECGCCDYFRKAEAKAVPTWCFDIPEVCVIIPICIRTACTFAIKKCDNFKLNDTCKEALGIKE